MAISTAATVSAMRSASATGSFSGRHSPTSRTSSVCSFSGSTQSDIVAPNKYLMKTLCLSKKTSSMPNKNEYASLLTCGLGARKWQASLDLDADSFRAAILNIYPRLSTVSSYTLWNFAKNKSFEKLPVKVNTPSRIKAYLGCLFSGCLVIMPSEEISMGPVQVPLVGNFSHKRRASGEKESGYDSFHETASKASRERVYQRHIHPQSNASSCRTIRLICLTCGRVAKQVGSSAYYNINNATTFTTTTGYISIAKKLKELFHLELPRSKVIPSEQICRKCFKQLNEIHMIESQLRRNKEDMMSSFFATVAKISRIDQIARESSSSSDASTSSSGGLGASGGGASRSTVPGIFPWIQEACYALDQQRVQQESTVFILSDRPSVSSGAPEGSVVSDRQYAEYIPPLPVFNVPGYNHALPPPPPPPQSTGKSSYDKHDSVYAKRNYHQPLNMTVRATSTPTTDATPTYDYPTSSVINVETAAEEETVKERAAAVFLEEAYHRRHSTNGTTEKVVDSTCSSSRSSSTGNNCSSSPDSQSPSPLAILTTSGALRPWKKRYRKAEEEERLTTEVKRARLAAEAETPEKRPGNNSPEEGPNSCSSGSGNGDDDEYISTSYGCSESSSSVSPPQDNSTEKQDVKQQ